MCLILSDFSTFLSLLTIFSLIIVSLPLAHRLHLPRCGGQSPCATLLKTLAPWQRLPHHTEATVNHTSRNPWSRMGPRMTSSTMTSPSARRSLYHCSPRSEKMMRAVDEPVTLKKKVCRPDLSSSVGHDRMGRPVVNPFDSQIPNVREIPSTTNGKRTNHPDAPGNDTNGNTTKRPDPGKIEHRQATFGPSPLPSWPVLFRRFGLKLKTKN